MFKCQFPLDKSWADDLCGGGSLACVKVSALTAECRTRSEIQGPGRQKLCYAAFLFL